MNNSSNELVDYLSEVANLSLNGEVPWTQPNPSSFRWIKEVEGDSLVTTIQKITNPRHRASVNVKIMGEVSKFDLDFMFQVQRSRSRDVLMALSSEDRPEFKRVLREIFESAEKGIDRRSSDLLRKLLR